MLDYFQIKKKINVKINATYISENILQVLKKAYYTNNNNNNKSFQLSIMNTFDQNTHIYILTASIK